MTKPIQILDMIFVPQRKSFEVIFFIFFVFL